MKRSFGEFLALYALSYGLLLLAFLFGLITVTQGFSEGVRPAPDGRAVLGIRLELFVLGSFTAVWLALGLWTLRRAKASS